MNRNVCENTHLTNHYNVQITPETHQYVTVLLELVLSFWLCFLLSKQFFILYSFINIMYTKNDRKRKAT